MIVYVRLTYILIDGSHYSSHGQAILTIILLASFTFDRLRITLSNRDRTRQNETFIITIRVVSFFRLVSTCEVSDTANKPMKEI